MAAASAVLRATIKGHFPYPLAIEKCPFGIIFCPGLNIAQRYRAAQIIFIMRNPAASRTDKIRILSHIFYIAQFSFVGQVAQNTRIFSFCFHGPAPYIFIPFIFNVSVVSPLI
jgi:hypothetical protein